ncbi:hypothetical protein ACOI1H_20045 [Loktanella sp. DJP18]|uniref:hypothetical protein n=1 Tax=Loktanella sp. DJP18 TaxID=3409788 RepID=UPI003BB7BB62
MSHLEIFDRLSDALNTLEGDDRALEASRNGIEHALGLWLDDARVDAGRGDLIIEAIQCLDAEQLKNAIRGTGAPFYHDLLLLAGNDLAVLRLSSRVINAINTDDIAILEARRFNYDASNHRNVAADWLVRGSAFAKSRFRKVHPRKNPVAAHIEHIGLTLPQESVCEEGAKMVADFLRAGRIPEKIETPIERNPPLSDWRLVFCMMLTCPTKIPYRVQQRLDRIFGKAQGIAILRGFECGTSHHEKLAYHDRMSKAPPLEDILRMPRDLASLDEILIRMDMAVSSQATGA